MKLTRKSLCVLAASLLLAVPASATRTDMDTFEFGLNLNLDLIGRNGCSFNGDLLAGYYVRDGLLLGGKVHLDHDSDNYLFGAFLTVEQHLNFDESPIIPYVGTDLGLIYDHHDIYLTDEDEDWEDSYEGKKTVSEDAFAVVLRMGAKYYLTELAAVDFSFNLTIATDDIFERHNKDNCNYDCAFKVGLRYCIF